MLIHYMLEMKHCFSIVRKWTRRLFRLSYCFPDVVIAETCQVEDQHGHEWLGIIFIDPETYQWLCQLILKNDDLLSYKKMNS